MEASSVPTPIGVGEQGARPTEMKREFHLWSTFALAFAFISPIVALYSIFELLFVAGGPRAWWTFPLVLAGQMLVALVFGLLASRWPFEGSVYQWSRRLHGETYGWFSGWAYMWTLMIVLVPLAYAAAGFVPTVIGVAPFGTVTQFFVALLILGIVTLLNLSGRGATKVMTALSITAEIIGSIGIGTILLFFHSGHPVSSIVHTAGAGVGPGGYIWSGFFAAMAFVGWAFVGFESAGAIAEEVKNPSRDVPKAILLSLASVGAVVIYAALALILAIPNFGDVISGKVADPVTTTITARLGSNLARPLFIMFIIGFMASMVAIQSSVSRVMWAYARDDVLPGSRFLKQLTRRSALPANAILAVTLGSALLLLSTLDSNIYTTLISFSTGGFYISFAFPLVGMLIVVMRRRWRPGVFQVGRWTTPVVVVASVWCLFEVVNIAWPRATTLPWYQNWGVVLMVAVVGGAGVIWYYLLRSKVTAAERRLDLDADGTVTASSADDPSQPLIARDRA